MMYVCFSVTVGVLLLVNLYRTDRQPIYDGMSYKEWRKVHRESEAGKKDTQENIVDFLEVVGSLLILPIIFVWFRFLTWFFGLFVG